MQEKQVRVFSSLDIVVFGVLKFLVLVAGQRFV